MLLYVTGLHHCKMINLNECDFLITENKKGNASKSLYTVTAQYPLCLRFNAVSLISNN